MPALAGIIQGIRPPAFRVNLFRNTPPPHTWQKGHLLVDSKSRQHGLKAYLGIDEVGHVDFFFPFWFWKQSFSLCNPGCLETHL